jgi:tRNA-specific 2-thiouridylase
VLASAAVSSRPRIVVAMSGGVDSSTAAALLCETGAEVIGVTLKLYDASGTAASIGGRCCSPRDIEDARQTAAALGFPHYVIDESEAFSAGVIEDFVAEYRAGHTPNPCVRCNEKLKFAPLVRFARAVGAEALATGHYARLAPGPDGVRLLRAVDREKDQSYFLFAVTPSLLPFVRFPLGAMSKPEVRAHAQRLALPNWDKPDSQQICFIPDGDHKAFVARRGGAGPAGEIRDEQGRLLGQHAGTHHFTIGQRKGVPAVGGADPRFVVRIDVATGRVHVGPRSDLARRELRVADARWLGGVRAGAEPLACDVQLRHHAAAHAATITAAPEAVRVELDRPVDAVAAGQAAVFFRGDEVLGGGWIQDSV